MCENKDRDKAHRPDLELERLVMGDRVDGVRPSEGWLVREDVARGAVEQIKSARDRAKRHAEDMQLAIARQNAALAERNQARVQKLDADKVAEELREQVEALTAQLEAEERMVKRLREDVLGSPRGTVKVEEVQRYVGSRRIVASVPEDWPEETKVALVRLAPDGLGLAGDADIAPQSSQENDEFKCLACGSTRKTTLFITRGYKSPEGCAECGLAIADDTEGADA